MRDYDIVFMLAISTGVILIFVLAIIIVNFMMNKMQLKQEMKEQLRELSYQKELRDGETNVSEAIMEYISFELHDNIQHSFTHLRLQLELLMNQSKEYKERLAPIENIAYEVTEQLRNLCRRLDADFISENKFASAILLEIDKLKRLGKYEVYWTWDEQEPILDKDTLLIAYRIFQETIVNILKHSNAKNVYISLKGTEPWLLEVKDDGIGFDILTKETKNNMHGIHHMNKRAVMAKMSFTIQSQPQNGCIAILSKTV